MTTTTIAAPPPWLVALLDGDDDSGATQPAPAKAEGLSFTPVYIDEGERPGDVWADQTDWAQLLEADGWTLSHTTGEERHWTRPGKSTKDGTSATTGYGSHDVLKVFSTSVGHLGLEQDQTYTKIGYLAATKHGGDFGAAARSLADEGYGRPATERTGPSSGAAETATQGPVDGVWPIPIPLGGDAELPPFPIHVLPDWITDRVLEVSDDLQVPADLPATLALGTLSTLASGKVRVQAHGPWHEDVNLFLVVAMPPSTGKSPAYKAMCKPVATLEAEYAKQVRAEYAANASLVASLEGKLKRAVQMDEPDPEELARLHEELFAAQEKPTKPPKLTAGDATPEKIEHMLMENGGRLAIHSTEGGVFGLMTGRYSDKTNLDVYLQGWSGDKIDTQRIGREGVVVEHALLTMLLTVQPSVIAKLAENPELAGRGLTARFMYSVPRDVLGTRDLTFYDPPPPAIAEDYARRMEEIGRRLLGWQLPATLTIEWPARAHFQDWRVRMEERRVPGGDLRPMAEWTGKLESSVVRVAALLHLASGHEKDEAISLSTMTQAIQVGEYWLAHACHVHDLWGTTEEIRKARLVIAWLRETGLLSFTVRDLYRDQRTAFPTADDTTTTLALLVERGWLATDHGGAVTPKHQGKSTTLLVNPELFTASVRSVRSGPRDVDQSLSPSPLTPSNPRTLGQTGQTGQSAAAGANESDAPGDVLDELDDF